MNQNIIVSIAKIANIDILEWILKLNDYHTELEMKLNQTDWALGVDDKKSGVMMW